MQQDPVHRQAPSDAPTVEGQGRRRGRQDQRRRGELIRLDSVRRARGPRSGARGHQFEAIRGPRHVSQPSALPEASRASRGGVRIRSPGPARDPVRRVAVRGRPRIPVPK